MNQPSLPQPANQSSTPELLEQIKNVRIERDEAEAELAILVDAVVGLGIGWPQIASQLGVTRQAARQQYLRRHTGNRVRQDHAA